MKFDLPEMANNSVRKGLRPIMHITFSTSIDEQNTRFQCFTSYPNHPVRMCLNEYVCISQGWVKFGIKGFQIKNNQCKRI